MKHDDIRNFVKDAIISISPLPTASAYESVFG